MKQLYEFIEETFHIDLSQSKFTINVTNVKNGSRPDYWTMKLWDGTIRDWELSNLIAWTGKRDMVLWKPGTYIIQIYKTDAGSYLLGSLFKVISCIKNPNFGKPVEECDSGLYSAETGCNEPNNRYTYRFEQIDLGMYKGWPIKLDFRMNQAYQLDCKTWKSKILMEPISTYTAHKFPGYKNVHHTLKELRNLIDLPEWKTALENQKGIYMHTDMLNGKHYIGSAYGRARLWSRLKDYTVTGHGGNSGLIELGSSYVFENFKTCILEECPDNMSDEEIIQRENMYKDKFMTREFGYNNN